MRKGSGIVWLEQSSADLSFEEDKAVRVIVEQRTEQGVWVSVYRADGPFTKLSLSGTGWTRPVKEMYYREEES